MTCLYLMYRLRPAHEEKVEMHKSYSKQVQGKIQKKNHCDNNRLRTSNKRPLTFNNNKEDSLLSGYTYN